MYRAGKHNYKPRRGREEVNILAVDGVVVKAKDISRYCTEDFFEVLGFYQITKMTEIFPNGNVGWANESADFIDSFLALASEDNAIQAEEMEKQKSKSAGKPKEGGHRSRAPKRRR